MTYLRLSYLLAQSPLRWWKVPRSHDALCTTTDARWSLGYWECPSGGKPPSAQSFVWSRTLTSWRRERLITLWSPPLPPRCPDGGFCSVFTAVHESQRWCEAPPTLPELSILPAHSLQSFLLLHAHSVPLWPAQTESDRGILHLGLNSTLSLVMCKSYLSVFLLLISNPFISLQGPSHSVLPQGFRIRTMSTTPWVVFTWQRKFQTEVFTNLLRKLLKLTIWRLGTCKQQMILTGWCFRPHVSKTL